MDNADMIEVFKRLGEKQKPLLDETVRELPLPEQPQPLFSQKEDQGFAIAY